MYQFVSSLAKKMNNNKEWTNTNISNVPLNELFILYSRIIVTLSNPFLPTNVAVDLSTITPSLDGMLITLQEFLISNGNITLPTLPNLPSLVTKYARYADGFKAGYKMLLSNPNTSLSAQQPPAEKQWLYLTKPNVNYNLCYKSCLISINGLFHLIDTDGEGLYVVDGMKSARKKNMNQLGMYSFADIGTIEYLPITASMLYKQNTNQLFKDSVYVRLDQDISNKTVMLVLGGYLHVLDNTTFIAVNDSCIKIDISNLPLLDRFYESRKILDFSSLPLTQSKRNSDQVSVSEFYSDANIEAYLTLSQSFFVILDNDSIFLNTLPLHKTNIPTMYVSHSKPVYPLMSKLGKNINYWSVEEDGQYSITCTDAITNNYIYDTIDVDKENSVASGRIPTNAKSISDLHFLEIGSILAL